MGKPGLSRKKGCGPKKKRRATKEKIRNRERKKQEKKKKKTGQVTSEKRNRG